MKKTVKVRSMLYPLMLIALLIPCRVSASGGEQAAVTNPAASIELADLAADSNFVLYSYKGTGQPVLPSDVPWYDTTHTVKVRLIGEDPGRECDDIVTFTPGQACDVKTESEGKVEGDPGTWSCTVVMAGHDGPSHYTAETTSGKKLRFMARAETIPASLSLNYSRYAVKVGGIVKLTSSEKGRWNSSDPKVAAVTASGIVTGLSDGTADIVSTYEGYGLTLTATCKVTVGTGQSGQDKPSGNTKDPVKKPSGVSVTKNSVYIAGSGISKGRYRVTDKAKQTVTYESCLSAKSWASVPSFVKLRDGKRYKVTKIAPGAFSARKNVKNIEIKTKELTKSRVKNCLRGSKVLNIKTVRYNVYKKYFTKKNCGKTVKIKKIG